MKTTGRTTDETACATEPELRGEIGASGRATSPGSAQPTNAIERLLASAKRPLIKTCGMFRDEDTDAVNDARPDLCGFIVNFPKSHRGIDPDRLAHLVGKLESGIVPVAVFVDQPAQEVADIAKRAGVGAVQLHGHEDADYVGELRKLLEGSGIGIIQAVRMTEPGASQTVQGSDADLVLVDSGTGSGKAFDWDAARGIERPFLLAGGIGPDNMAQAFEMLHPAGFDMSSSLETDRRKDPRKIAAAVAAARRLRCTA